MRKTVIVSLCALLLAGAIGAGETIRVMGSDNPWTMSMKSLVAEFEKETGIKVVLEQYGEDQLMQKVPTELIAGNTNLDVIMIRPQNDARMYIRNNWLLDLTPFVKDDAEYDFADYTAGSMFCTNIKGFQSCIPVVEEQEVLYYRKDLFEAKGIEVPTTFEEMEAAAKLLTDREKDISGFVARGQRSPSVTVFANYLFSYGGDFCNLDTMTALIDTPEFLNALDYYGRMLRNYGPPGILNMSWQQASAVFAQGKAAMYTEASSLYPNMMDPTRSSVADLTGVALFPRGPVAHKCFSVTGWGLAIPSVTQKKDLAWKFIRYMTDKERTLIIQGKGANQCARTSTFLDPAGVANFPAEWVEAVKNSAAIGVGYDRPLINAVGEARDIIGEVITTAISGGDYKAAAKRGQVKFQELLDREKAQ